MILKDESLYCRQIKFCDKIIHRWQDEIEHFIWISHASGEIDLSFASFSPQILIRIIFNLQQMLFKSVPPTICFCIKWVVNLFYSSHEKTSSLHIKIGLTQQTAMDLILDQFQLNSVGEQGFWARMLLFVSVALFFSQAKISPSFSPSKPLAAKT